MSQKLLPRKKAPVTITITESREKCEKQWKESRLEAHLLRTEIAIDNTGPQGSAPCSLLGHKGNAHSGHTKHVLSSDVQMIVFGGIFSKQICKFYLKVYKRQI